MAKQENLRYGDIIPKKDKDEYKKDLHKAHFQLGTIYEKSPTSYDLDFAPFTDREKMEKARPLVDNKSLRASHFFLGMDKPTKASIYAKEFGAKTAEKVSLKEEVLNNLRGTHYKLGKELVDYKTINNQDYVLHENKTEKDLNIDSMKAKMRTHHFRFGDDLPMNQTSSAATYRYQNSHSKYIYYYIKVT